jgi:ABC-type lipoprotein export system ATPase subunit
LEGTAGEPEVFRIVIWLTALEIHCCSKPRAEEKIKREVSQIPSEKSELANKLQAVLDLNKDKRVVVVGTTCTGKSTLLQSIIGAHDMDELIFPQLTPEETVYVEQQPWTEDIGRTMERLAKERVKVRPGEPVFGTIVFDADLIVDLQISNDLLLQRTAARGKEFEDAKNMRQQIERNIAESGIPKIDFSVG